MYLMECGRCCRASRTCEHEGGVFKGHVNNPIECGMVLQ
jgi:hypothetical protein